MSRQILTRAIETFGISAQYEMLQEEATELALAARKHVRMQNDETFENLAEEIADVSILMEQMTLIHPGITAKISKYRVEKMDRLEKRIEANDLNLSVSADPKHGTQLEIQFPD